MFLFYDVFINHFPKIHRSVLRKVTIDLLYIFEMFLMSIYGKKLLTQLVNQTYFGNFTCLQTPLVAQNCQASVRFSYYFGRKVLFQRWIIVVSVVIGLVVILFSVYKMSGVGSLLLF